MKLAASMIIVAGVFTMPVVANAQSVSTADSFQAQSQHTVPVQTAAGYASQDVDGLSRETQPVAAGNDRSGDRGQSNETRRTEMTYSSYSPPVYVVR
ncbi:hypothetical protein [Paraburkholderia pallida]|uniref:DUF4148 domain-containing protein n=1 Tax=Paraburkholderia pallida TaxID=2547399 RepID=A0A4P7CYL1_9BURK|nr:hypothetical protein [Paraburkholderia pallida]QBR01389.1 hypothetical protein E1956_29770 [Paraburkholderia pallida]